MVDNTLVEALLNTGILQFGYFAEKEDVRRDIAPIRLNFQLLPAYPHILKHVAEIIATEYLNQHVDRIICPANSLPLGTAISLITNKPLVYARGKGENPVHDLVGAYDVGHPAALVMNQMLSSKRDHIIIREAHRVGLNVQQIITISGITASIQPNHILLRILVPLEDLIEHLSETGVLSASQKSAVDQWLTALLQD